MARSRYINSTWQKKKKKRVVTKVFATWCGLVRLAPAALALKLELSNRSTSPVTLLQLKNLDLDGCVRATCRRP